MTEPNREDARDDGRVPSIRTRIVVLAVLLGVVLLGLHGYTAVQQYEQARDAGVARVIGMAQHAASSTGQFMVRGRGALEMVARERGAGLLDPSVCATEVAVIGAGLPFLTNVAIAAADGTVVCSLQRPQDASTVDMNTRDWFLRMRESPRFIVSSPYPGGLTGDLIVTMAAPILDDDGTLLGVVGGPANLAEFQAVVLEAKASPEDLITIGDERRMIVARSDAPEEWVGEPLPPRVVPVPERTRDGREFVRAPDVEGRLRVWGEAPVPVVGWTVFAAVPVDVVFGPAASLARTQILMAAVLVVLAALLALWTYRGLGRPLILLASGARAAAAGSGVPIPPGAPREVRVVADEFNRTLEARDRARSAERRARDRYRTLFDNAVVGIYRSTVGGDFLDVNPALASMLGYDDPQELKALGLKRVYRDPEERERLLERYVDETRFEGLEVEWLRKDGSVATLRLTGKLVSDSDAERVFEVFARDITREAALRAYTRHQQKMEALGRIAGGLSHEFNNLLTVIQVNAEILQSELESTPLNEEAVEIRRAAERGATFTRRLLSFSRHDVARPEPTDVNDRVRESAGMLRRAAGENIEIALELDREAAQVEVDPAHLDQALLNLVLNARDALSGKGRVTVATTRRNGGEAGPLGSDQPYTVLAVSDHGSGMTPDVIERAFEPFFTTKPVGKGTGLGLAAVHGIVQEAGGFTRIVSAPGEGCLIELWLPAGGAQAAQEA